MALKTLNTSMDIPKPFQFKDIYNNKMSILMKIQMETEINLN